MISVQSIETFSTVDGPGIRTVIFLNGCNLRCIYCHNPEMWNKSEGNKTTDELFDIIIRNKEYYGEKGGVTFSGGEPLLQAENIIDLLKKLKENGINVALDTAGVGNGKYDEILKYIDLIIFDVKHTTNDGYKLITQSRTKESLIFLKVANDLNKKFWIRQVIVPGIMDNNKYLYSLKEYLKNIKNIERIEFLPYHKLGREKYLRLGIPYILENVNEMDKIECDNLYNKFISIYKKV